MNGLVLQGGGTVSEMVVKARSFLMLSVVVFLWGSSYTLLKLGLEKMSPINLAFLRFLLALPILAVFAYLKGKKILDSSILQDWKILAVLGLTGVTLYHIFQNVGLRFTTASNSSLIISANPVFIALLAHFYLREKMTWRRVSGIALAFFGIILIIGPLEIAFNPLGTIGDLLSVGAGLSWAIYSVFSKRILSKYGAERVTMFSMIFGALFLFPILLVSEEPALPTSAWIWFLLLILSLLCSGMAYLFWYIALEEVSPTKAGVFLFFLPIVSLSLAHLILSESIDVSFAVGAVFVMLGIVITQRS
ncbi:MAG: DMT family transporter [Candidatus Bathyarchaeota archaeon]|nr:DMT family transporter [Candidatus Bathyarchaeota archaeon]